MTPSELSALYDIKRILERVKSYCENRSLSYDGEYERWNYVASEANDGLIKVRDIEMEYKKGD